MRTADDIRRTVKIALASNACTLKAAARLAGIQYDRAAKIVNGDRPPRPGELTRLSDAIAALGRK